MTSSSLSFENWAGNYRYTASGFHRPETIEQLQALVARSAKVKALGSRHSFNDVADTTGDLISLEHFDTVVALDRSRSTITMEGGIRYAALSKYLHAEGYALPNLASLPHISVAGACATATHGSGVRNGNLAVPVSAVELLTANGEIVSFSREKDPEVFPGTVVHIGALGIATKLTLDLVPTFPVQQSVYRDLPMAELAANFDTILSSAYSVSLFTDWSRPSMDQVWRKHKISDGEDSIETEPVWFGATLLEEDVHPIAGQPAENSTTQRGIPGPWYDRLPHFRADFTPSSGEELQTEYYIPYPNALAAIQAVFELRERITPLLHVTEIRTIAADDLWMSPCYGQTCVAIHFTWKKNWPAVSALMPVIEERLLPLGARPHWGKLFTVPGSELAARYERLPDFSRLAQKLDPQGKFRNRFLDEFLG